MSSDVAWASVPPDDGRNQTITLKTPDGSKNPSAGVARTH